MQKGETVLTGAKHPGMMPEVMESPAGFYIGFRNEAGMPYSRESKYFMERSHAEEWLGYIRLPETYRVVVPDSHEIKFPGRCESDKDGDRCCLSGCHHGRHMTEEGLMF